MESRELVILAIVAFATLTLIANARVLSQVLDQLFRGGLDRLLIRFLLTTQPCSLDGGLRLPVCNSKDQKCEQRHSISEESLARRKTSEYTSP